MKTSKTKEMKESEDQSCEDKLNPKFRNVAGMAWPGNRTRATRRVTSDGSGRSLGGLLLPSLLGPLALFSLLAALTLLALFSLLTLALLAALPLLAVLTLLALLTLLGVLALLALLDRLQV